MVNKSLFKSIVGRILPKADTVNEAGGRAYSLSPKHALAQYAATGCLNGTFYATAGEQLDAVLALSGRVEPEFVARTALYARGRGHMKDMPALLCAVLSGTGPDLLAEIFDRVIDIINVAGFSDQVFDLIADVARGRVDADHWVRQIEAVRL